MSIMASVLMAMVLPLQTNEPDFWVSPEGKLGNPGTREAPFAGLQQARDAVRSLISKGLDKDLVVSVAGGAYALSEALSFGPDDSDPDGHSITYQAAEGQTPIITGGQRITGWRPAGQDRWTVEIPEVKAGTWWFRQLFKDGQRLPRSRFPNPDEFLRVATVSNDVTEILLSDSVGTEDLAGKDAELVVIQNWSISRVPIASSQGKVVKTSAPVGWIGHGDATTASPGKACYIEHGPAYVDEPGEWYLDRRTGILTYRAEEGKDPNEGIFVAPKATQLLAVTGTKEAPVRNLRFVGLAFEHTAWDVPSFGYLGIQAGHYGTRMDGPIYVLPLALQFVHAQGCVIEKCVIAHTGASGVGFGAGCQDNKVMGCRLSDIGGDGIMVGWRGKGSAEGLVGDQALSADWPDRTDAPKGNEVSGSVIERCGAVCFGCVGIYDGFCQGTHIAHNEVRDMPYTGISVGFRWDSSPTSQRDCVVEYNHIHDCMKMLADGGGIYTLGYQPGTTLRGNLIHDIHRSPFAHGGAPNNGIFFDQGSKGFVVEGNIFYLADGGPTRFNECGAGDHIWKDNVVDIQPGEPGFPAEAAAKAGPSQQSRHEDSFPPGGGRLGLGGLNLPPQPYSSPSRGEEPFFLGDGLAF